MPQLRAGEDSDCAATDGEASSTFSDMPKLDQRDECLLLTGQ